MRPNMPSHRDALIMMTHYNMRLHERWPDLPDLPLKSGDKAVERLWSLRIEKLIYDMAHEKPRVSRIPGGFYAASGEFGVDLVEGRGVTYLAAVTHLLFNMVSWL